MFEIFFIAPPMSALVLHAHFGKTGHLYRLHVWCLLRENLSPTCIVSPVFFALYGLHVILFCPCRIFHNLFTVHIWHTHVAFHSMSCRFPRLFTNWLQLLACFRIILLLNLIWQARFDDSSCFVVVVSVHLSKFHTHGIHDDKAPFPPQEYLKSWERL